MKNLFITLTLLAIFAACKSTNVVTPTPNTVSKAPVDTALQGDKMKDATKQ